ncbi:hypothetical protein BDF14DRAFT_1854606 [Spinellus fusiger]|nr:hypothetical protein BDF14DRAFT_1854606 [Spinellus fusiger]
MVWIVSVSAGVSRTLAVNVYAGGCGVGVGVYAYGSASASASESVCYCDDVQVHVHVNSSLTVCMKNAQTMASHSWLQKVRQEIQYAYRTYHQLTASQVANACHSLWMRC